MSERSPGVSIGVVSRLTEIPVNTLRTWERRYGYPLPERTTGGQRVYSAKTIEHLKLVARALAQGHRPAQVLTTDEPSLRRLLGLTSALVPPPRAASTPGEPPAPNAYAELDHWLDAIRALDADALQGFFRSSHSREGLLSFLTERAAPLLVRVGEDWRSGLLQTFHEHFASEVLRDFLAAQWRPLAHEGSGPSVVCATLPDEQHVLGIHMAAAVLAMEGCRIIFVGPNTPLLDLRDCVEQTSARALFVGISPTAGPIASRSNLRALRHMLPASTMLVVGGGGAPSDVLGVVHLPSLGGIAPIVIRLRRLDGAGEAAGE